MNFEHCLSSLFLRIVLSNDYIERKQHMYSHNRSLHRLKHNKKTWTRTVKEGDERICIIFYKKLRLMVRHIESVFDVVEVSCVRYATE